MSNVGTTTFIIFGVSARQVDIDKGRFDKYNAIVWLRTEEEECVGAQEDGGDCI